MKRKGEDNLLTKNDLREIYPEMHLLTIHLKDNWFSNYKSLTESKGPALHNLTTTYHSSI